VKPAALIEGIAIPFTSKVKHADAMAVERDFAIHNCEVDASIRPPWRQEER
jgi:hypothetical protein